MRRCEPAPRPHRLHLALGRNFQLRWPVHSVFETRPAQTPHGPPPRLPFPRRGSSRWPPRFFVRRPPAELALPEWAAAQRERCSRRRSLTGAVPAFRQFPPPGPRLAPESSGGVEELAAIPQAFAICELFPSREYLRSYHTRLQPLNAFAPRLARTGERVKRGAALSNVSIDPGKLLLDASRYF